MAASLEVIALVMFIVDMLHASLGQVCMHIDYCFSDVFGYKCFGAHQSRKHCLGVQEGLPSQCVAGPFYILPIIPHLIGAWVYYVSFLAGLGFLSGGEYVQHFSSDSLRCGFKMGLTHFKAAMESRGSLPTATCLAAFVKPGPNTTLQPEGVSTTSLPRAMSGAQVSCSGTKSDYIVQAVQPGHLLRN